LTGFEKRGNFVHFTTFKLLTTFQTVTTPRPSEPLASC